MEKITIKGVTDTDIAYALADLAGFSEGTFVGRTNNFYDVGNSPKCVVVLHKDVIAEMGGDIMEVIAYRGPTIIVSQVYRPPQQNETDWKPTDEYAIEFDDKKVDKSLIAKIEEEIRSAYSNNKK